MREKGASVTETGFYVVWNPSGGSPTVKHQTKQSAIDEAVRLARAHRGQKFVVLEAVCARIVDDVKSIDYDHELPF